MHGGEPAARWGDDRYVLDDEEARGLLVDAVGRCVARRGNAQVSMAEVALEARVSRSTVYRYFAGRDELLLALVVRRTGNALREIVAQLSDPDDAARSLREVVLATAARVGGNPLNEALMDRRSAAFLEAVDTGGEAVTEASLLHCGPLLARWQAAGQVHADLDPRDTVRWLHSVVYLLSGVPWNRASAARRAELVDQYLVRALVVPAG